MRIRLQLEFGVVDVFESYVVVVMHEGITVKPEYNDILVDVAERYFSQRPFAYITFRKNSYAVDPRIYIETSKIKNLEAFVVVAECPEKIKSIDIEKMFAKKPFMVFDALEEATNWVTDYISKKPLLEK
ncbi:MAG: hypothetical protein HKM28_00825 [Flavobacteriaceae bacterium]|nr:hypothetical protein [Flavobacteriaceae bacterium]